MKAPYFETFEDTPGQWRWRLRAANGRKIATSGEWFTRRADATRAATNVKQTAQQATVRVPIVKARLTPRKATPDAATLAAAIRSIGKTKV